MQHWINIFVRLDLRGWAPPPATHYHFNHWLNETFSMHSSCLFGAAKFAELWLCVELFDWMLIRWRDRHKKPSFMWKILAHVKNLGTLWNIRHHWVQLVPISCSLARNAPLRSFVVFCGPLWVLCGPLRQWCIAKNEGGYTQTGVAKGLKVPCLFMITEVSIRSQKKPRRLVYVVYPRIPPPQYTTALRYLVIPVTAC